MRKGVNLQGCKEFNITKPKYKPKKFLANRSKILYIIFLFL